MFGNRKPSDEAIQSALSSIAGASVDNIVINHGTVRAILSCDSADPAQVEIAAEQALKTIKHVKNIEIIVTANKKPIAKKPANTEKIKINAKHIIAVASGKGGVGKSTIAINIAGALAKSGQKIGLLDADIYGPSIPRMAGLSGEQPEQNDEGKIVPLRAHAMDIMSIGFMIGEDNPLIWRGPMVQSAFTQLLQDVAWSELDVLVIDMPPGTGDIQLTMAQRVPLTGAIIVSTPQDIALIDVRKGIEMFDKVDVPIIGLVENMSYYTCDKCGHQDHIFGHRGAEAEAKKLDINFLGHVPLAKSIREQSDQGLIIGDYYDDLIKGLGSVLI